MRSDTDFFLFVCFLYGTALSWAGTIQNGGREGEITLICYTGFHSGAELSQWFSW